MKGKKRIPGSDGRCGPTNGPQCEACKAYQVLHPIENQFAHLAMNEGQLFREARDPVQGQIDMNEDFPIQIQDDDEESVKTTSPRYPERMIQELVDELVEKKFPTDVQSVINQCKCFDESLDGLLDEIDDDYHEDEEDPVPVVSVEIEDDKETVSGSFYNVTALRGEMEEPSK